MPEAAPLAARITVQGVNSSVWAGSQHGDYYRYACAQHLVGGEARSLTAPTVWHALSIGCHPQDLWGAVGRLSFHPILI